MTIPRRLKEYLDRAHVSYEPVFHIPTHSSEYTAATLHIPGIEMAKAIVLRAGDETLLAVLAVPYHINLNKLAAAVGAPVRLVDKEECKKLFPDCEPGAVPPFGELYGLPVCLEQALADDLEIVFSAGSLYNAVRMGNLDFIRLVKPRICSFAERLPHNETSMESDLTPPGGQGIARLELLGTQLRGSEDHPATR